MFLLIRKVAAVVAIAAASVFAIAPVLSLTGCAAIGVTAPKSFDEKALAAAMTVDQVQKTAAALLRAGRLSVTDAENVLKSADAAVAGIVIARSYGASNPAAGTAKLEATIAALAILQTYLATQGAAK